MTNQKVPYDQVAEESIIAAIRFQGDVVAEKAADLDASDFYTPRLAALWGAFRQHWDEHFTIPDDLTWANAANGLPYGIEVTVSDIIELAADAVGFNRSHVDIVKRHRAARDIIERCETAKNDMLSGGDPYDVASEIDQFVSEIGSSHKLEPESKTFYELCDTADADSPAIIPGMLHKDWRAIIVAPEGAGKAVLMRTMCQTVAHGFHPMTHRPIEPRRTLLVDLENPTAAIIETGMVAENAVMQRDPNYEEHEDWCRIWHRPGGINLRNPRDRADFQRELVFQKPELVCIGPLYKMSNKKPGENYEDAADEILRILDNLRVRYGFALVIEHHAAKGPQGSKRDLVAMGSQRFMAWPELGIGLRPNPERDTELLVENYRTPRLSCSWPTRICRDAFWVVDGVWDNGGTP